MITLQDLQWEAIVAEYNQFVSAMQQLQEHITDPHAIEHVQQIIRSLQDAKAELDTALPEAIKELNDGIQSVFDQSNAITQQLKDLEKQVAAQAKAQEIESPAPPADPELPVDPELGFALRVELLAYFEKVQDAHEGQTPPPKFKNVWEDWS